MSTQKWMTIAQRELGQREIAGPRSNPRIIEYFKVAKAGWAVDRGDEVPWCSGFACFVMERAGYISPRSLRARDWLAWGTAPIGDPPVGAITILSRGDDPNAGHVGFLVGADERGWLQILGGNQSNAVTIQSFDPGRVLGFRLPIPEVAKRPILQHRPVLEAAKHSWTITGALASLAGTLIAWAHQAIDLSRTALQQIVDFKPVAELASKLGLDWTALGIGLAVSGVVLAVARRVEAAAKGAAP